MIFVLICLSLSLAGITGLQFFYLAYLDRLDKDQKKRIRELERHCQILTNQLDVAETSLEVYTKENKNTEPEFLDEDDNEVWADVLEEA